MTKKIGILFGMEDTFPWKFIDKVNELGKGEYIAEPVQIDKVQQGVDYGYHVIIDRISQEVPFYRAYLKNAALMGTAVINNPFWWSADEKFFNNALAIELGVPVPKTILLPSKERPDNTSDKSFRNLKAPLDWEYIFNYIGFPAYMKPHDGGGWKSVYQVTGPEDLFEKHAETEQLVMMLQEEIVFEDYYRVYCLGQKYVHIMPYEPRNAFHERYATQPKTKGAEHKKLMKTIHDYTLKLNQALGYDFNTVEFAVREGVPYAIDFCNPAPDADIHSVGEENFDWIVKHAAKFAIEKAKAHKAKQDNCSWGTFVQNAIAPIKSTGKKPPLKTAAEAKKSMLKKTIGTKKKKDVKVPTSEIKKNEKEIKLKKVLTESEKDFKTKSKKMDKVAVKKTSPSDQTVGEKTLNLENVAVKERDDTATKPIKKSKIAVKKASANVATPKPATAKATAKKAAKAKPKKT